MAALLKSRGTTRSHSLPKLHAVSRTTLLGLAARMGEGLVRLTAATGRGASDQSAQRSTAKRPLFFIPSHSTV